MGKAFLDFVVLGVSAGAGVFAVIGGALHQEISIDGYGSERL